VPFGNRKTDVAVVISLFSVVSPRGEREDRVVATAS